MQHRFNIDDRSSHRCAIGLAVTAPAVTSANASDSLTTASAASFAATFDLQGPTLHCPERRQPDQG